MLRTIHLHGELGNKFIDKFTIDVESLGEAINALKANFKGFDKYLIDYMPGFHVRIGNIYRDYDTLVEPLGSSDEIHLIPAISGGSGKLGAIFAIIIGVVLIAMAQPWGFAFFEAGTAMASFVTTMGVGLIMSGISALLFAPPKVDNNKGENDPSTYFNGAVNTIKQGYPVPVGYGELIIGSAVISGGIESSNVPLLAEGGDYTAYNINGYEQGLLGNSTITWKVGTGDIANNTIEEVFNTIQRDEYGNITEEEFLYIKGLDTTANFTYLKVLSIVPITNTIDISKVTYAESRMNGEVYDRIDLPRNQYVRNHDNGNTERLTEVSNFTGISYNQSSKISCSINSKENNGSTNLYYLITIDNTNSEEFIFVNGIAIRAKLLNEVSTDEAGPVDDSLCGCYPESPYYYESG